MNTVQDFRESRSLARELIFGPFRILGGNPAPVLANLHPWIGSQYPEDRDNGKRRVNVLLDESVLGQPELYPERNSVVILNLEILGLVHLANEHVGPIRWFCQSDPRELLGPMLDHYRGTYYRKHLNQIVYASDGDLEFYDLPQGTELNSNLLASVCAAREAGIHPKTLRAHFKRRETDRGNF